MPSQRLRIVEHRGTTFHRDALTHAHGETILSKLGRRIDIEFPTPRTADRWILTSQGWVGLLRVDDDLTVIAEPKVPVANLARMLQVAHELPIEVLDGLVTCETIEELYDQLARLLADAALSLVHHGLHHVYRPHQELRSSIRGRLLLNHLRTPRADPRVTCAFNERTADTIENRIVSAALHAALRGGYCTSMTRAHLRKGLRQFVGRVTPTVVSVEDVDQLRYDRLTARYRRVHALARLFLDERSPLAREGDRTSLPFLLHMPSLFERFVERWLRFRIERDVLPLRVLRQEKFRVGDPDAVVFSMNVVITDNVGRPICVLDTKYKDAGVPAAGDVAQVAFYAQATGARSAGLIYPTPLNGTWQGNSGSVNVFAHHFDLSGDLERAGGQFLSGLLHHIGTLPS